MDINSSLVIFYIYLDLKKYALIDILIRKNNGTYLFVCNVSK